MTRNICIQADQKSPAWKFWPLQDVQLVKGISPAGRSTTQFNCNPSSAVILWSISHWKNRDDREDVWRRLNKIENWNQADVHLHMYEFYFGGCWRRRASLTEDFFFFFLLSFSGASTIGRSSIHTLLGFYRVQSPLSRRFLSDFLQSVRIYMIWQGGEMGAQRSLKRLFFGPSISSLSQFLSFLTAPFYNNAVTEWKPNSKDKLRLDLRPWRMTSARSSPRWTIPIRPEVCRCGKISPVSHIW